MEIEAMQNARPLTMPAALLMELDRNGASLDVYRELEELYRTAQGYEFSWGQIIETGSGAREGREWEFILTLPLARVHAVGGTWAKFPISA
jgi:hypothetical protein